MKTHTYMDDEGRIRIDADEETIKYFRELGDVLNEACDRAMSRMIWRESKLAWFYWQLWGRWKK